MEPEVRRALGVVSELDCAFSVREWAEVLGWSRPKLRRLLRRGLGQTPRQVLREYLLVLVRRGRRRGATYRELAAQAGYANKANLLRALRREGWEE